MNYLSAIHGTQQLRVNWKHTKRVLEALIDNGCLSNFTWSGKGKDNKKTKNSFKELRCIRELLIRVLKTNDQTYDFKLFKEDIVKHIIKRAYENNEK